VWNPDTEDSFEIQINAYQWYFEFEYTEPLTWEDTGTGIDVDWSPTTGLLSINFANGSNADTIEVKYTTDEGVDKTEYNVSGMQEFQQSDAFWLTKHS